jgi:hypothetical protein
LIPFFLFLGALVAFIPLYRSTNDQTPPPVVGAEVRGRAEISGLFAHVADSGKKLEDGRPVFTEIDPGTPRLSCLTQRGLPEIKVFDEKDGEVLNKGEGEVKMPRSGESWKTFGVGKAV